jgi:hypothetical protein
LPVWADIAQQDVDIIILIKFAKSSEQRITVTTDKIKTNPKDLKKVIRMKWIFPKNQQVSLHEIDQIEFIIPKFLNQKTILT